MGIAAICVVILSSVCVQGDDGTQAIRLLGGTFKRDSSVPGNPVAVARDWWASLRSTHPTMAFSISSADS
jgi:hypothetical protein